MLCLYQWKLWSFRWKKSAWSSTVCWCRAGRSTRYCQRCSLLEGLMDGDNGTTLWLELGLELGDALGVTQGA